MNASQYYLLVLLLGCCLTFSESGADTWALPKTTTYSSKNGDYRLTIVPGFFMGEKGPKCRGKLEHKNTQGQYEAVWECDFVNAIAPVSALVCDSGKYVVTFDNWHSLGEGKNVVVIYGPNGKLIREHSLASLLSQEQIRRFAMTVSSTWWSQGHYLDEKSAEVVLRVATDNLLTPEIEYKFEEMRLNLSNGELVKPAKAK